MEIKTEIINGKYFILRRNENGAWKFNQELTDKEWEKFYNAKLTGRWASGTAMDHQGKGI